MYVDHQRFQFEIGALKKAHAAIYVPTLFPPSLLLFSIPLCFEILYILETELHLEKLDTFQNGRTT